tara:strand:- start:102 stop:1019 length:918 start_codon:yes stop_codon:yes gene_type:complete
MTSTLETCANTAARPASPAPGDAVFQEDTKQIIVWDGSAWRLYDAVGNSGWTDSDITGLSPHLWLDSNYSPSFFTDSGKGTAVTGDGERFGCWADRSGNGFDWLQTTTNLQPNIVKNLGPNNITAALFGKDNITFSGTSSSEIDSEDMTFVWAVRLGVIDSQLFWNETNSNTRMRLIADGDNFQLQLLPFGAGGSFSGGSPTFNTTANAAFGRETNLIAIRTNSSANTTKIYLNGGSAIGSSTAPTSAGKFLEDGHTINMINSADEAPYWVFDLILFNSSVSDANLNTVFSYLGNKHGITTSAIS